MSTETARLHGRSITDQMEEILRAAVHRAQQDLSDAELTAMMLKVASSISISAILLVVQLSREPAIRDFLFDAALEQIHSFDRAAKPRALAMLAEVEAGLGR